MNLSNIRQEYKKSTLIESNLQGNPIDQFDLWMKDAIQFEKEPTAFLLATATKSGLPSTRIVLLKDFTKDGFTFFTNYTSRKGAQMAENPFVSITFFWPELERQIHIEGSVTQIEDDKCDEYFYSRPLESQIGATLSNQSAPLLSKEKLMEDFLRLKEDKQFKPTRPLNWGGYLISPNRFEFWQGGAYRLHDRFSFELIDNKWETTQLNP